jgi:hypothetical protein
MKYAALLHPYLYVLAALLFLYPVSYVVAPPNQMIRLLIVLWIVLTFIYGLALLLIRDIHWASIFADVVVLGFFSHSLLFVMAASISLIVVVLLYLSYRLLKRRLKPEQIGLLLTLIAFLLSVSVAAPLMGLWMDMPAQPVAPAAPIRGLKASDALPDVYYIVLDGYGRSDILDELYGLDNSGFVQALESRGFIVPEESRSNYPKTALSVASSLNMDYVQSLAPVLKDQIYWWLMSPLIRHNSVRANLENLGYRSVAIATDWGITNNTTVDEYHMPAAIMLNDFETFYIAKTPLAIFLPTLKKFAFVPDYETHGDLILYNFTTLKRIADQPGPKFIFAHILAPHPPFVFKADGARLQPDHPFSFNDGSDFHDDAQSYRNGYAGQVQFVNGQIIPLIDSILDSTEVPPIIILQADHGPGMMTDFKSLENTCLRERFSVFAAYHLPGMDPVNIPSDITPVNLFRIIFNQYFSARLPLLESRQYYYSDVYIYDPIDVTSLVDTCRQD